MSVTPEYPVKRRCDVRPDEEWRSGPNDSWVVSSRTGSDSRWVEFRRARQPDPLWLMVREDEGGFGVTTVDEMRARTDLKQWEYASNYESCEWLSMDVYWEWDNEDPDDFPIIVRRKS